MDLSSLSNEELMSIAGVSSAPTTRQPRGLRNNNPLNLEATVNWTGMQGNDGRFAVFPDLETGVAAADRNLQTYANKHGLNTVSGVINRWAPPSENDSRAYAQTVAQKLGVGPDDPLDMSDPQVRRAMLDAMADVENGQNVDLGAAMPEQQAQDLTGFSDEELMRIAGIEPPKAPAAPPKKPQTVARSANGGVTVEALGEDPTIAQDAWSGLTQPFRDLGRTISAGVRQQTERAMAGPPSLMEAAKQTGADLVNTAGLAGQVLGLTSAPLQAIIRPVARGVNRYAPTMYETPGLKASLQGQAPRALNPQERQAAIEGVINTALSAAQPASARYPAAPRPARGEAKVAQTIRRAIARDQMTPRQVLDAAADAPHAPAFMAGGDNLGSVADVVAQTPGPGRSILRGGIDDFRAGSADRVKSQVAEGLGGTGDYFSTLDAKMAERAARSAPARDRAFAAPVNPQAYGEDIAPLLPRVPKRAVGYAMEIAKREGVNPNDLGIQVLDVPEPPRTEMRPVKVMEPGPMGVPVETTKMQPFTVEGAMAPQEFIIERPTMKTLHYIKKGIDQELENYRNAVTGRLEVGSGLGAATAKLRQEYGSALRKANPDYDEFMRLWGDDSAHIAALELGRDVFSAKFDMSAERLQQRYIGMNDAERDMFRKGIGEALVAKARGSRGGVGAARDLLKSEEFRDRVRIAFPDEKSFGRFMSAMDQEVKLNEQASRVLHGSPTYTRQAARADLEAQPPSALDFMGDALDAATSPARIIGKAAKQALAAIPRKDRSVVGDPRLNELLGKALAQPDELARLLDLLNKKPAPSPQIQSVPLLSVPGAIGASVTAAPLTRIPSGSANSKGVKTARPMPRKKRK